MTAADVLIETLIDWNVDRIFGLPGDGINGIMEALRIRQDKIRFIQVRHEETAAFMACAHAKYTGRLGVCLATSGPGGIHLLNGLYDAKLDGAPVLALTGLQFHDLIGTYTQQDVALDKLFMDVCVFNERIMGGSHVENVTDLACRMALGYKGVAHLTMPVDLQSLPVEKVPASQRNKPHHTADISAQGGRFANPEDIAAAAEILNKSQRVAILVGRGALGARREVEQLAQALGAPVIKALLGKAVLTDDSPYTTGGAGLLGTRPSQEALESCDALLMIGTSFPYIEFLPKPGSVKGIQIDLDPKRIGLRYPVDLGLVGDTRRTLEQLLPLLTERSEKPFLTKAQDNMREWRKEMESSAASTAIPMKPQVIAHALGELLPENAIVSCDSGTITAWWARHIPVKEHQMHSVSGTLASMACALPYALAAQLAYPDRLCVAFAGDGGFSMLMAEFATAVKYKLPIKVVVMKNLTLGQIKWEQIAFLGNPEYGCELQDIDFVQVAQACGGTGVRISDPVQCRAQLEQALRMEGPVLIEAIVDALEPPMPAKVTVDQAAQFARAVMRGEPEGAKILAGVIKEKFRQLV